MNILIFDEHPLAAQGLASLLTQHWPGARTTLAHSVAQANAQLGGPHSPDWLLLGVHTPDDLKQDFFRWLLSSPWMRQTVLLTAESTHPLLQPALDAGLRGVIPLTAGAPEVLEAFAAVLRGEVHVPPRLIPPLRRTQATDEARPLSPRLRDVLRCLLRGTPNKLIARELGISEYTVKEYVSQLLAYHGVANRLELVLSLQASDPRASAPMPHSIMSGNGDMRAGPCVSFRPCPAPHAPLRPTPRVRPTMPATWR